MKKILSSLLLTIIISFTASSQDISGNQEWKVADDYRAAEQQIVANILWIEQNPIIEESEKSREVARYVMKWILGCPYLTVKLDGYIIPMIQQTEYIYADDLQGIYLFGKMLYLIENRGEKNESGSMTRGIESMLTAYEAIKEIKGDSAINEPLEKFHQLRKEGKLNAYIKDLIHGHMK